MQTLQPLSNEINDTLEVIIIDHFLVARSFTSLDVANELKAQGYRIRNYEVAAWLRSNAIVIAHEHSYLYDQSLITVDSRAAGITLAYLYHHYQVDKDEYLDRDQNPKSFSHNTGTPAGNIHIATILGMGNGSTLAPCMASPQVNEVLFTTREKARDYARNNSGYKFEDRGFGEDDRWACISV